LQAIHAEYISRKRLQRFTQCSICAGLLDARHTMTAQILMFYRKKALDRTVVSRSYHTLDWTENFGMNEQPSHNFHLGSMRSNIRKKKISSIKTRNLTKLIPPNKEKH
jgi:hypothetical protein